MTAKGKERFKKVGEARTDAQTYFFEQMNIVVKIKLGEGIRWLAGHLQRMTETWSVKKVVFYEKPDGGRRRRGRTSKRQLNDLETMGMRNCKRKVMDRDEWWRAIKGGQGSPKTAAPTKTKKKILINSSPGVVFPETSR